MSLADEKFMAYWERRRPQGKLKYSLKVALWLSLPMSFGSELFRFWTEHDPALQHFNFIKVVQFFVTYFVITYWVWGVVQWNANENRYQKLIVQK